MPVLPEKLKDWKHIIQCDAPSRSEWRQNMIKAVDTKSESLKTHPEMRAIMIDALQK
jgi:hypothetical protein